MLIWTFAILGGDLDFVPLTDDTIGIEVYINDIDKQADGINIIDWSGYTAIPDNWADASLVIYNSSSQTL